MAFPTFWWCRCFRCPINITHFRSCPCQRSKARNGSVEVCSSKYPNIDMVQNWLCARTLPHSCPPRRQTWFIPGESSAAPMSIRNGTNARETQEQGNWFIASFMCSLVDVAIGLTEGWVAGIARGEPVRIIGSYVKSPLRTNPRKVVWCRLGDLNRSRK